MSNFTFRDVLHILRLIDSGSFSDLQIEFEGINLKVTRRTDTAPMSSSQKMNAISAGVQTTQSTKSSVVPAHGISPKIVKEQSSLEQRSTFENRNGIDVKPPMAGTFYPAPSPGTAPFVEVGYAVHKGDQLGIVEVMKLFTPLLSPCDGIVLAILVGNEEFVQSDQTLMIIEASEC